MREFGGAGAFLGLREVSKDAQVVRSECEFVILESLAGIIGCLHFDLGKVLRVAFDGIGKDEQDSS